MSSFDHLQRKRSTDSTPAAPTSHWLQPSRPFAPLPTAASEQVPPTTQEQLEPAARFGHSFERLSILPPETKNTTGLPDALKASVENLSGLSMDNVQVHYNSSQPAEVQALAYTQGTEIHVGSGQEQHLPHEAWHVVQQMEGRVKPTVQAKGAAINNDQGLEREADAMGAKAGQQDSERRLSQKTVMRPTHSYLKEPLQRKLIYSRSAIEEDKQKLTVAYAAAESTGSAELINAAESLQIPELAQALRQQVVAYVEGQPTPLAGERLHYLVGHVGITQDELNRITASDWAGHETDQVARDFVQGGIESPSTIILIGCKAGQFWGPQLAKLLKGNGKDVTVVATTGIIHATGVGIASYAPTPNAQEALEEHGFTGDINEKVVEEVKTRRKKFSRKVDGYRKQMRKLLPAKTVEAEQLLEQMKTEIATFFNELIQFLNQTQPKPSPFAITAQEGGVISKGTEATRPVTETEAMLSVPSTTALPEVIYIFPTYVPRSVLVGTYVQPISIALPTLPYDLLRQTNPTEVVRIFDINRSAAIQQGPQPPPTETIYLFDINRL